MSKRYYTQKEQQLNFKKNATFQTIPVAFAVEPRPGKLTATFQ